MQQYGGGGGGGGGGAGMPGKNQQVPPWARNNKVATVHHHQQPQAQAQPQHHQPLLAQHHQHQHQQQHHQPHQPSPAQIMQYQSQQPVYQSVLHQHPHQQHQHQNNGMALMQQAAQAAVAVPQPLGPQMAQAQGQLFPQQASAAVAYSTGPQRALNHNAFCSPSTGQVGQSGQGQAAQTNRNGSSSKQRVFAGTVTKARDDFGFVDEDVFYQTSACVKGSHPAVGDRVLVEASYSPNLPFKWNATRIQVLPSQRPTQTDRRDAGGSSKGGGYERGDGLDLDAGRRSGERRRGSPRREGRVRSRDAGNRTSEESERKRKRIDRDADEPKEKSAEKDKARSPSGHSAKAPRRPRVVARYMVQVPKFALDIPSADVLEVKRRYGSLYVPSDFFRAEFRWVDAFPPQSPFAPSEPCAFHIVHKDVDDPVRGDPIPEPTDVDYSFSAKVMLLSAPTPEQVYAKCCGLEKDERERRDPEDRDFIHPTRLINFLVGLRGKNETMAIGGPWSPSADGPNPESDPSVLVRTAIRTCKAHTGIDLSACTQWYRFVELYYRRAERVHRGRAVPARVETVVVFVPDVWSCLPTRLEWDRLVALYENRGEPPPAVGENAADPDQAEKPSPSDTEKKEPTHFSELDPKTMSLGDLKKELWARNINSRGLKSQLVARLAKAIKVESCQENAGEGEVIDVDENEPETEDHSAAGISDEVVDDSGKKNEEDKSKNLEKEKSLWKSRNTLPENPHIIVHPSRTAKSGKFDCTMMTLSLLLDYRQEDSKEHSFEVSLFAELFNEMLMRDFGFNIYKALYKLPDKPKEEKEDKKKEGDSKQAKTSEKHDDKKEGDPKKTTEKKDDKSKRDKEDSVSIGEDESSNDKKPSTDKKEKKDRPKLVTKDPQLLLSFVYFDTSHCGYIFEKDMEELLYTLGLNLSRAQVRKLVAKVVTRESFHYRQLTDKPKDEETTVDESLDEATLATIASGNKTLLPVFKPKSDGSEEKMNIESENSGMVEYKGALLDIEKLLNQLKRSEQARLDTEARLVELINENNALLEKQAKATMTAQNLQTDLDENRKNLKETQMQLSRMTMSSKIFHMALKEIQTKVVSVIHTKMYDDPDNIKNVKNESTNSRWSDDSKAKKETTEENASEGLDNKEVIKSSIKEEEKAADDKDVKN